VLIEYRVNTYESFQIPPKPSIEVRTNQSGLLPRKRRAEILRKFYQQEEPHRKHFVEVIQRSHD
jgi:hypothetical protein